MKKNEKMKKISYPIKYHELITDYGEEVGYEKYCKFLRGVSLEKYVLKYGEELGNEKYNDYKTKMKTSGVSLQKMIINYGEELGTEKYINWKLNTRQDLNGFINRYGEKCGEEKYNTFKQKSLKALEKCDKSKILTPRQLDYWIKKCDNVDDAKLELQKFQNNASLSYMIKKYGEVDGKEKYIETNKKRATTIENMVKLYGEIEGKEKYDNWIKSNKNPKEKYITKYGKILGEQKYNELIISKTKRINNYSNIGLEFCQNIVDKINYNKIYYGDNEYMFYIFEDNIKIISPDLYIKDINLVIEFYGDFWHKNPNKYKLTEEFVKETWENDEKRINTLKTKYNCDVIIVWENDYLKDKHKTIEEIIQKIITKYGNS